MNNIKESLQLLSNIAKALGLGERDLDHVGEFIKYKEFELGFDNLITQMYEYDIEIDDQIYKLIVFIGGRLKLPEATYDFMQELIRRDQKIPKPIAEELIKIIKLL